MSAMNAFCQSINQSTMCSVDTISYLGPTSSDYYSSRNRLSRIACWLRIEARPSYPRRFGTDNYWH